MLVRGKEVLTPKVINEDSQNSSTGEGITRIQSKFGNKKDRKKSPSINQDIQRVVNGELA